MKFKTLVEQFGFGRAVAIVESRLSREFFLGLSCDEWCQVYAEPSASKKLRLAAYRALSESPPPEEFEELIQEASQGNDAELQILRLYKALFKASGYTQLDRVRRVAYRFDDVKEDVLNAIRATPMTFDEAEKAEQSCRDEAQIAILREKAVQAASSFEQFSYASRRTSRDTPSGRKARAGMLSTADSFEKLAKVINQCVSEDKPSQVAFRLAVREASSVTELGSIINHGENSANRRLFRQRMVELAQDFDERLEALPFLQPRNEEYRLILFNMINMPIFCPAYGAGAAS